MRSTSKLIVEASLSSGRSLVAKLKTQAVLPNRNKKRQQARTGQRERLNSHDTAEAPLHRQTDNL